MGIVWILHTHKSFSYCWCERIIHKVRTILQTYSFHHTLHIHFFFTDWQYQTRYILRRRLYVDWTCMGTCTGTCMGVVLIILIPNQHISILQFIVFTEQQNTEKLYEVQPAWHQVLVVAAHQTICRGETKTRTIFILPIASCYMLMLNAIQVVATSERWIDSLARMRIISEQVSSKWKHLLLFDHFSEGIQIFLMVSDKWSCYLSSNSFWWKSCDQTNSQNPLRLPF